MSIEITKSFRYAFEGHHIQVTVRDIHAYIIEQTADGDIQTRGAALISGYFVDYDEVFLYLGTKAGDIENAIPLDMIAAVSKQEVISLSNKDAEFFSLPKDDSEVN